MVKLGQGQHVCGLDDGQDGGGGGRKLSLARRHQHEHVGVDIVVIIVVIIVVVVVIVVIIIVVCGDIDNGIDGDEEEAEEGGDGKAILGQDSGLVNSQGGVKL